MNTMKKIEWTGWQGQSIANYATLRKKTSMYTYCIHVNNMYAASSTPLSVQLRVKWQVFRAICNSAHDTIWNMMTSQMNWNPFIDFGCKRIYSIVGCKSFWKNSHIWFFKHLERTQNTQLRRSRELSRRSSNQTNSLRNMLSVEDPKTSGKLCYWCVDSNILGKP